MENGLKEIRKDAFINGLILGALLLALDILALYTLAHSQSMFVVILAYLFGYLVIPLLAALILIRRLRKKIGGYWTFRQATSGIFIIFLSAYIISSAGSLLFVKYIQPQITVDAKNNFINVFTGFLSKINAEPDEIDEAVETIEVRFDAIGHTDLNAVVSNILSSIIILFIAALIFAAIFKRERPTIFTPQDLSDPEQ